MRWSNLFIPTLRDTPGDAEAVSHQLLVRAGYIRQLHSGHYSLLPLGLKAHTKVAAVIREEMDLIGGQEFIHPAIHPASVWQQSGRWETMGQEMFRLVDRRQNDLALGMTHEEVFTIVSRELDSYKELPQIWYQIQTKFRDEPRPKAGLLRVREFDMKDSYSFDIDDAGLDLSFDKHHDAYVRIFARLGLPAFPVVASSGAMGGGSSLEFMVPSPAGEDDVAMCPNCDYRANIDAGDLSAARRRAQGRPRRAREVRHARHRHHRGAREVRGRRRRDPPDQDARHGARRSGHARVPPGRPPAQPAEVAGRHGRDRHPSGDRGRDGRVARREARQPRRRQRERPPHHRRRSATWPLPHDDGGPTRTVGTGAGCRSIAISTSISGPTCVRSRRANPA